MAVNCTDRGDGKPQIIQLWAPRRRAATGPRRAAGAIQHSAGMGVGGEGNVQSRVATHLAATGWSIIRVADTAQRERGVDIIAERAGQRLLVEVKG